MARNCSSIPKRAPVVEPTLVERQISFVKVQQQVASFQANEATYRERGYWIAGVDGLDVFVAYAARAMPIPVPIVVACVRFRFVNFDLWAPSLTFVDFMTRQPLAAAPAGVQIPGLPVRAFDSGQNDSLINQHPTTGLPFLCQPGVHEYHSHPQHSGDSWLLRRGTVSLSSLAEVVWAMMVRNIVGSRFDFVSTPIGQQLMVTFLQGAVSVQQMA